MTSRAGRGSHSAEQADMPHLDAPLEADMNRSEANPSEGGLERDPTQSAATPAVAVVENNIEGGPEASDVVAQSHPNPSTHQAAGLPRPALTVVMQEGKHASQRDRLWLYRAFSTPLYRRCKSLD